MNVLPRVVVLVPITLVASACAGSHSGVGPTTTTHMHGTAAPPVSVGSRMVSSSRLVLDGRVRCTATVSRSVPVGSPLGLTFAVRNVSSRPVEAPLYRGGLWLVVRGADGTIYDTRVPLRGQIGPIMGAAKIPPGATRTVSEIGKYLRVRWRGPLQVTPGCGQTALPVLPVGVKAPGLPPDETAALASVIAASGHLLDHCLPERAGVAVEGKIYPPSGDTPPMSATCSVSLQNEGHFLVAQALIASPPDLGLGDLRVNQYEQLSLRHASPYEAIAWQFVVTKGGAKPVAAAEADATKPADRFAPDWSWTSSGVQRLGSGNTRCGGSGGSWGGTGPIVTFISVCPA